MNLTKFDKSRQFNCIETPSTIGIKNLGNCFDCEKLFNYGYSAMALKKFSPNP